MVSLRVIAGVVVCGLCTGCSITDGRPPATVEVSNATVVVGEADSTATLHLWVSNQSFDDDPVVVTVTIDDEIVADGSLFVEGQHNWIPIDVHLAPGSHELTARSTAGVEHTAMFEVLDGAERFAVLDYWYSAEDPRGRHFTFMIQDDPVYFD